MMYLKKSIDRTQNPYKAIFADGCYKLFSYSIYGDTSETKRISVSLKAYADKEAHDIIMESGQNVGQIFEISRNYLYSDVMAYATPSVDIDEMITKAIFEYMIDKEEEFADAVLMDDEENQEQQVSAGE